jgi:hypothetical protein
MKDNLAGGPDVLDIPTPDNDSRSEATARVRARKAASTCLPNMIDFHNQRIFSNFVVSGLRRSEPPAGKEPKKI